MYKLSKFLKSYINDRLDKNNKIFLKMIVKIRVKVNIKFFNILNKILDQTNCIYGLDADLIMLSLCAHSKIYLLREEVHLVKLILTPFYV